MAVVPIVLEFSRVAKDSSLSLTLLTAGAAWSLGEDVGDGSMGFSYNALTLGEMRQSCISSVELTDSVLTIRTSANAATDSFTFALFLDVSSEVEAVQGYCTLNMDARVVCHLGYGVPSEWRSGIFSAIVPPIPVDYRRIRLNIQGPLMGAPVSIELMTESSEPGAASWSFAAEGSVDSGFRVRAIDGTPLCIQTLSISERKIKVGIGTTQKNASDLLIDMYLRRVDKSSAEKDDGSAMRKLQRILLRADRGACAAVIAQVGAQRPQYLTTAYKCFYF
jgi:hypothetical protein